MKEEVTLNNVLFGIEAGKSFQTLETLARDDELGVLKVSAVTWSAFRPEEAKAVVNYEPEDYHRVKAGDLLISRANTREFVGAVVLVENDYPLRLLSDKTLRLIVDTDRADKSYLLYALRSNSARKHIEHFATGTSDSMRNISQGTITSIPIALPKIDDQRRIAARLKTQLAAVEEARQAAQAQVKEVQALSSAFLRELEESLLDTYKVGTFAQWVESYRNGFGKRPKPGEDGPIVLRIADVSSGIINLDDPRRGEVSPKEAATYRLIPGDLLFVRVNGAREIVGRCCVVGEGVPPDTIFNDHLIRAQLRNGLLPGFARLCMSLPTARAVIEEAASTSAGQLTVNQQILDSVEIPLLPKDQQTQVVNKHQEQMDTLEQLRAAAKAQLEEIELLPARLLAQAFESQE